MIRAENCRPALGQSIETFEGESPQKFRRTAQETSRTTLESTGATKLRRCCTRVRLLDTLLALHDAQTLRLHFCKRKSFFVKSR